MCSVFEFLDMDNFQGDLTDIIRGSGGGHGPSSPAPPSSWPPPPSDLHVGFPLVTADNSFGDPFVNMTDPLLHELNLVANPGHFPSSGGSAGDNISSSCRNNNNSHNTFVVPKVFEDEQIKNQCNVFPRIRISQNNIIHEPSPCNSPVVSMSSSPHGIIGRSPAVVGNDMMINVVDTNSPRNCLVDKTTSSSQIQISSPRNLGLKRRKSQAKKVVCIPAPAAANSRSSGEVVPSDLWAWRKYGQKPIKGSPYPRGYYRCSSSKGCSARKQVERSRTNPNMLVITYTSEHNHPWPTQRNALAGSTRSSSHSSKPSTTMATTTSASPSSRVSHTYRNTTKDEPKPDTHALSDSPITAAGTAAVKEECADQNNEEPQDIEFDNGNDDDQSYRPDFHQNSEDFFADLDELEGSDPLHLLLPQGFCSGSASGGDGDGKNKSSSDAFGDFCFDWTVNSSSHNDKNTTSFEDPDESSKSL